MGSCLMGKKFQFGKVKRVLDMNDGDGCTTMYLTLHVNVRLKMVKMVNFMYILPQFTKKTLAFLAQKQERYWFITSGTDGGDRKM